MEKKKARKKIALLLAQPEESTQSLFVKGFLQKAFALDYDVAVFSMYIKYQNSPEREIGDSGIFSLISYDKFDAVVVMADTIQTPDMVSQIEENIKKSYKGKVLFIDKKSRYFPTIDIDNYYPVKKLISHLIERHSYTDIAFLSGKSWHPHSKIRVQAYKDALIEHGIEPDDDNIYYGDFWYTSGESLAERMSESKLPLPRALACANDYMAIGAAKVFSEQGLSVPDDIAVVGFDTNEEGQHAPIPLTSVPLPSHDFGMFAAETIDDMLHELPIREFVSDPNIFIGGTCGCKCDSARPVYFRRENWNSLNTPKYVFSLFNNLDDDLLGHSTFNGLVGTIFSNVFQIAGYKSFTICLNEDWATKGSVKRGENAFSPKMLRLFMCGPQGENKDRLTPNETFDTCEILPEFFEEREKPAAFFFMPLYFEDRVYGFSAISYGDRPTSLTPEYRAWLKSVSRGIEYLRRSDELIRSSQILESEKMRDRLTGLLNYEGFRKQALNLISIMNNNAVEIGVLAIDLKDLSGINNEYGRTNGDMAIVNLARFIETTFSTAGTLCFCIGNGEMVAASIISGGIQEMMFYKDKLLSKLEEYNSSPANPFDIDIYTGIECGTPKDVDELEYIVNIAVSKKNGQKTEYHKIKNDRNLSESEQNDAKIVQKILDDNNISYHFQPIVSARDGRIVAYEALMRANVTPYLAPPLILRYAEFFERLYDVEKATFNNVLNIIRKRKDIFDGTRKVFINSIPNCILNDDDMKTLRDTMVGMPGSVVVELTEQAEMSDEELASRNNDYAALGVETAVDDYGTGYSNVTNLLRYMPDYVKIDRMLLSGIENSPQKQHFVKDIIRFSHDNSILALAEGVETQSELDTVIELGVDLVQGYYTGKPSSDIVTSIDPKIISDIEDANYLASDKNRKIYHAGREERINLAVLKEDGITRIEIVDFGSVSKDLMIVGAVGLDVPLDIVVKGNYHGSITFENASIGMNPEGGFESPYPAITVSGSSNVAVILKGNNTFRGGFLCSDDSDIHIEGHGLYTV